MSIFRLSASTCDYLTRMARNYWCGKRRDGGRYNDALGRSWFGPSLMVVLASKTFASSIRPSYRGRHANSILLRTAYARVFWRLGTSIITILRTQFSLVMPQRQGKLYMLHGLSYSKEDLYGAPTNGKTTRIWRMNGLCEVELGHRSLHRDVPLATCGRATG